MVDDLAMGPGSSLGAASAAVPDTDAASSSAAGPDFGILLLVAARAFADDLHARLAAEGFPAMRAGFGFMFRAMQGGEPTPGALAVRLGVSKQAVGKVLDEMEQRGFVERRPDPVDRRVRHVRLTEHGRAASQAAMRLGGEIEADLCARVGADQVAALRTALMAYAEAHGGGEDAAARRARPTW
jgi:DNA-binding MarR family transcriptional regulator